MLKLLVIFSLSLAGCLSLPTQQEPLADPVVSPPIGSLMGKEVWDGIPDQSYKYIAFKGIPYAEPPTGNNRFRAPVPHAGWTGIRDAQSHGNQCVQTDDDGKTVGDEDCLFLNVYTEYLSGSGKPVMFWIHGGAYTTGSGDVDGFGPSFLLNEGVVVVTINYRLGIFGFLGTNDSFAPGNAGLKDILEALNWVRRNIAAFTGDPDNITIFGESAGGALIHFMVLSPLTKGLFKRAISESGTALTPWAVQPDPRSVTVGVCKDLGIDTCSSEAMLRGLRSASVDDLQKYVPTLLDVEVPLGTLPKKFGPVVDSTDTLEPRFLPKIPLEILKTKAYNDVPYIIGMNSDEALWNVFEPKSSIDQMNANPNLWIPNYWNVQPNTPPADEVIQSFRDTYFGGGNISDIYNYTKFHTDSQFGWPTYKAVQYHVQQGQSSIFHYVFSYDGAFNYGKIVLGLTKYPGAMHTDEVYYIWKSPIPDIALPEDHAYTVRSRMGKMWTNFAKTGDPTPSTDSLIKIQWPRSTSQMDFMKINEELSTDRLPFEDRMKMWREFDAKYGP